MSKGLGLLILTSLLIELGLSSSCFAALALKSLKKGDTIQFSRGRPMAIHPAFANLGDLEHRFTFQKREIISRSSADRSQLVHITRDSGVENALTQDANAPFCIVDVRSDRDRKARIPGRRPIRIKEDPLSGDDYVLVRNDGTLVSTNLIYIEFEDDLLDSLFCAWPLGRDFTDKDLREVMGDKDIQVKKYW
jgi:hypothetical protein